MAPQKSASPARCGDSGEAPKSDQLGGKVIDRNSASPLCLQVTPTGRKWRASLDGETLCRSVSPLIMAARVLVARGIDPNSMIEMWRAGADTWSLRGKLSVVAATLVDGEKAPRRAKNGSPVRYFSATGD